MNVNAVEVTPPGFCTVTFAVPCEGAMSTKAPVPLTVPGATAPLIEHATQFVGGARDLDLDKPPGVAETIDWVAALVSLGVADLPAAPVESALASLGALAKTPDDRTLIRDAFIEYSRT